MKVAVRSLWGFALLLGIGCGRKDEAPKPAPRNAPPAKQRPQPPSQEERTITASSEGALGILGLHPVAAKLREKPTRAVLVRCAFDHPLEGDVVVRFLDKAGIERGQVQQHIHAKESEAVLEFKVPGSAPLSEITSIHFSLPK